MLEAMEGVGSQRNWKENQDMPIQNFSPTGPAIWSWNMEDHKNRWKKTEQFPMPMPETDTQDWMTAKNGKQESRRNSRDQWN